MNKFILLVVLAGSAWWYFVGGRNISEEQVANFYKNYQVATLERKPDGICELLAADFRSTGTATIGNQTRSNSQNKNQTCESLRDLYNAWDKLGEKMGGVLQLDSDYTIHSIEISPDKKTAAVDISSSLDVAGSIMNIRSRSTDTLIRRNGKVLLLRSEGHASLGSGS